MLIPEDNNTSACEGNFLNISILRTTIADSTVVYWLRLIIMNVKSMYNTQTDLAWTALYKVLGRGWNKHS